jgi:membrane protein DedA with SNARE-associated domain
VVISDGLLYLIGRTWGLRVLTFPLMRRVLPQERLERIQRNFQKHGVLILLFARVLPGIRSPIFLTAGIMKLSWRRFLLADGIYALPGVSLLFFLAFWFTDQFRDLVTEAEEEVSRIRPLIILAAILGVGIYFVIQFLRHPIHTGDPEELPLIGDQVAASMQEQPPADEEMDEPRRAIAPWDSGAHQRGEKARPSSDS